MATQTVKLTEAQSLIIRRLTLTDNGEGWYTELVHTPNHGSFKKLETLGLIEHVTEGSQKVRLTDAGREYAIAHGWLPAPDATQAPAVQNADASAQAAVEICDYCGDGTIGGLVDGLCRHCRWNGVIPVETMLRESEAQPHAASGDAADDEPDGYMCPCDVCDGSGTIKHPDYGYLPCSSCDGTGIHTPEDELLAADLRVHAEMQATIATQARELEAAKAAHAALRAQVESLTKQVKRLKKTANLDDGYIDFLEAKKGE